MLKKKGKKKSLIRENAVRSTHMYIYAKKKHIYIYIYIHMSEVLIRFPFTENEGDSCTEE